MFRAQWQKSREEKKVSQRLRSTLYFRFWLLLLFIRRLTSRKNLNQTVLCYFCFFSACALSELYRAKIFDYFSLFTEHSTQLEFTASRFGEKLNFMTMSLNAMRARDRERKKIRISSYFAYGATGKNNRLIFRYGSGWIMCCLTFELPLRRRHAWHWDELLMFFSFGFSCMHKELLSIKRLVDLLIRFDVLSGGNIVNTMCECA